MKHRSQGRDRKAFSYEDLSTKSARLAELNALLNMDRPENEILDSDRGDDNSIPTPVHSLDR